MPGTTTFTDVEAAALDEKPVGRYLLGRTDFEFLPIDLALRLPR